MEQVALADIRVLADIYGTGSHAAKVLKELEALAAPRLFRCGRRLLVCDAAEDTIVIRRFW